MVELDRFMHCALPMSEMSAIVRHLMTRCKQCRRVTAALWKTLDCKPLDFEDLWQEPDATPKSVFRRRWPRAVPLPRLPWQPSAKAYAAMASAGQECLRDYVAELKSIRSRLQKLLENLPQPPSAGDEWTPLDELRAMIACVLQDRLAQAIADLHAASIYPDEPDDEEPGPA